MQGLDPTPLARVAAAAREIDAMPAWPSPGSVAMVSGTLVLKLGPFTPAQRRELEAAAAPMSATR